MAATAINYPDWSFVQGQDLNPLDVCVNHIPMCLPLTTMADVDWQAIITTLENLAAFIEDALFVAYPIKGTDCEIPDGVNIEDLPYPKFAFYYLNAAKIHYGSAIVQAGVSPGLGVVNFVRNNVDETDPDNPIDYTNFDTWNSYVPEEMRIKVGDCFRFAIFQFNYAEAGFNSKQSIGCTNCFIRQSEECYLSKLIYSNNENAYGFIYEFTTGSFQNKIKLAFYLHSPQLPSKESSYRKSDGIYIKLSERIEEIVELETDMFPMQWHRKLKVALSHDNISIVNPNYVQTESPAAGFVCKDDYELNHPDPTLTIHAKGKTKLTLSAALSLTNSNCV